jgi:PTH1 family peptidyl-tRNA hydrolase
VAARLTRLFDKFRVISPVSSGQSDELARNRWVIAGLGNPGEQYRRSRHNTGFMAVARLAEVHHLEFKRRKFSGLYAEGPVAGVPAIVVMPQTFYNRSGDCLAPLLSYFRVPPERLIVIHDEMDLPFTQIRIKRGGGDAGNRGVRSAAESLGSRDFIRIRIGISHPGNAEEAIDHVLKPYGENELRELRPVLDRVAEAVSATIKDGLERAMNTYNQRA